MRRRAQTERRRALAGEGSSMNPPSPQEANEQETMAETSERRDWSSLPDPILDSISKFLLSEDITEYLRFRAVCPDWRRCTSPPSNIESRFRPRNWILITSGQHDNFSHCGVKDPCYFFNVFNGNRLGVDIPQFRQGFTPISVVEGLLVLLKMSTGELCLLNPFSLSLTELPNVDSLLSIVRIQKRSIQADLGSVNFLSSTVVVLCFNCRGRVVFARIRGDKWIGLDGAIEFSSTVFFHGQLYAAVRWSQVVMQFELEEVQNRPGMELKLGMKPLISESEFCSYQGILVSKGQMFLLRVGYDLMEPSRDRRVFEVYRVDVENGILVPAAIPRDCIFFISDRRCLSIPISVAPSLLPESIYYCQRLDPSIKIYSHRPNLQPAHFYYPHTEKTSCFSRPFCKDISPYSLPSHLMCYCANFYMPPDSLHQQEA